MDRGLATSPNAATFMRFTSKGLWLPTGSIHGVDLGSILMTNIALNLETEKVDYVSDGSVVNAAFEAIKISPEWTIEGNQYHTQVRGLILGGTANSDNTIGASAGSPQTIVGAKAGNTYDLGVRGITTWTSLVSTNPTGVTYTINVDYEIDLKTGLLRILEGGAITTHDIIATYVSSALTRESYNLGNSQNQSGTLKMFGIRAASGQTYPVEEASMTGTLFPEQIGDIDPKKHKTWKLKLGVIGFPILLIQKT